MQAVAKWCGLVADYGIVSHLRMVAHVFVTDSRVVVWSCERHTSGSIASWQAREQYHWYCCGHAGGKVLL